MILVQLILRRLLLCLLGSYLRASPYQVEKDGKETVWPLLRQEKGVWKTTIPGDWERASYTYLHKVNGQWLEVHDPYALF